MQSEVLMHATIPLRVSQLICEEERAKFASMDIMTLPENGTPAINSHLFIV